jgi:hypothetical protein
MAQPMSQQTPPADPPPQRRGWWKFETGPDDSVDALQEQFRAIFESAGSPTGAALFCNHLLLACTTLLFTPAAAALARPFVEAHGGVPCDDPTVGILLVGGEGDRDLLPLPELTTPAVEQ